MSLVEAKNIDHYSFAVAGLSLAECDICGNRFSWSMRQAWPFCDEGRPHKRKSSREQMMVAKRRKRNW